jgi:DNA-binding PadR family transcriptional regulator
MYIKRYIEVLSLIPYYSIDLKDLETKIREKYGISYNMAYQLVMKLKREGLVIVKRRGRRGHYYVKPSPLGKQLMLEIVRSWALT